MPKHFGDILAGKLMILVDVFLLDPFLEHSLILRVSRILGELDESPFLLFQLFNSLFVFLLHDAG